MACGGFGLNHDIQCGQLGPLLPEALTYRPFDPVAAHGAGNGFLGHRDSQPGQVVGAQSIDVETGIRDPESLTEDAAEFRRDMQPGRGWKSGAGLA